jgi:hypothetical protein
MFCLCHYSLSSEVHAVSCSVGARLLPKLKLRATLTPIRVRVVSLTKHGSSFIFISTSDREIWNEDIHISSTRWAIPAPLQRISHFVFQEQLMIKNLWDATDGFADMDKHIVGENSADIRLDTQRLCSSCSGMYRTPGNCNTAESLRLRFHLCNYAAWGMPVRKKTVKRSDGNKNQHPERGEYTHVSPGLWERETCVTLRLPLAHAPPLAYRCPYECNQCMCHIACVVAQVETQPKADGVKCGNGSTGSPHCRYTYSRRRYSPHPQHSARLYINFVVLELLMYCYIYLILKVTVLINYTAGRVNLQNCFNRRFIPAPSFYCKSLRQIFYVFYIVCWTLLWRYTNYNVKWKQIQLWCRWYE